MKRHNYHHEDIRARSQAPVSRPNAALFTSTAAATSNNGVHHLNFNSKFKSGRESFTETILPSARNKLYQDMDEDDSDKQIKPSKTPSPPQLSVPLLTAKHMITYKPPNQKPSTFKYPVAHSQQITTSNFQSMKGFTRKLGEMKSSTKRYQVCSNRLFKTPSTGLLSSIKSTDDGKNTDSEDMSTKLQRLAQIGLLDKLKGMQFSGMQSEHDEESDRESNKESDKESDKESVTDLKKFKVKGKVYVLLSLLGQGGSSKVYQVFEPITQRNLAMKVVDLSKADEATRDGFENEIQLLQKLATCERVVRLIDYDKLKGSNGKVKKLFLVMEKGDTDLANVLKQFIDTDARYILDSHVIKHYWKEMLKAVHEIHSMDVVHSDLKPVNFITVSGKLKLIDFGIANAIQSDHTSVIKDTQIGTINYMAPESLQGRPDLSTSNSPKKPLFKFNCKADIWSLGCILYNLVYGKPPFGNLPNLIAKIQAICNPKYAISYPPYEDKDLINCIKSCLERDPRKRPTTTELLEHPYLHQFYRCCTKCSH